MGIRHLEHLGQLKHSEHSPPCIAVIATGGTIAGSAGSALDNVGYRVGERDVDALLQGLPLPPGLRVQGEQLAQIDSKDMDAATWQRLARRVAERLARPDVRGVVVTHGTDTLEETAWLLQRVLAPAKPVVLTGAMRPASSLQADGPRNLADALTVAADPDAAGVLAAMAGRVHAAAGLRKAHSWRLDAFDNGDAGPLACVEQGRLRWLARPGDGWGGGHREPLGLQCLDLPPERWPWVEIVVSHAAARPEAVDALVAAGVRGLIVAGTGNATVHAALLPALARAEAAGVALRRVTRCAAGPVVSGQGGEHRWPAYADLGAPQARVELMLEFLTRPAEIAR
jgi:L-asparaginase